MTRVSAPRASGFTLIEMLVVIAIMVLLSGLILANNNRFGGVILLQNLAYDMALSIRQAQVFGTAVQRFDTSFEAPYGMHFQVASGGQSAYILFADTNDSGYYDPTAELVQSTLIATGYSVSRICTTGASSSVRCDITSLDITFRRPEPDAYIRTAQVTEPIEKGTITVTSPRGDTKTIAVYVNGQISVE